MRIIIYASKINRLGNRNVYIGKLLKLVGMLFYSLDELTPSLLFQVSSLQWFEDDRSAFSSSLPMIHLVALIFLYISENWSTRHHDVLSDRTKFGSTRLM